MFPSPCHYTGIDFVYNLLPTAVFSLSHSLLDLTKPDGVLITMICFLVSVSD